jgi:hypothetical protein
VFQVYGVYDIDGKIGDDKKREIIIEASGEKDADKRQDKKQEVC